jgi:hypothetical protein
MFATTPTMVCIGLNDQVVTTALKGMAAFLAIGQWLLTHNCDRLRHVQMGLTRSWNMIAEVCETLCL